MVETAQVEALITEAHTWLNTPYHAHARIKGKGGGVDCAQLLIAVYEGTGLAPNVPVPDGYSTVVPKGGEYIDTILLYCDEIDESQAQRGDVVVYKTSHGWMHSGIVVSWPNAIIHATEKRGVVMTTGVDDFLRGKPRRFFRLR